MEEKNNSTTEHKRTEHNNIFQKAVSNSLSIQSLTLNRKRKISQVLVRLDRGFRTTEV